MKLEWSNEKNQLLKEQRNICFEDVEREILKGNILDLVPHFNKDKFPNQKIIVIKLNDYVHYVPYILNKETNVLFLKTIVPSRKLNKFYKLKD
jgi:uncharacterized DUF497 family protein